VGKPALICKFSRAVRLAPNHFATTKIIRCGATGGDDDANSYYTYGYHNRMVSAANDTTTVTYKYNAQGVRIDAKTAFEGFILFIYPSV